MASNVCNPNLPSCRISLPLKISVFGTFPPSCSEVASTSPSLCAYGCSGLPPQEGSGERNQWHHMALQSDRYVKTPPSKVVFITELPQSWKEEHIKTIQFTRTHKHKSENVCNVCMTVSATGAMVLKNVQLLTFTWYGIFQMIKMMVCYP